MNRLNPLHVAIILLSAFVFFAFKLSNAKEELVLVKEEYKEAAFALNELSSLSGAYLAKDEVKKSLQRILAQPSLKDAHIEEKLKSSSLILSAPSVDKEALNSLMGKLLNGAYDVASLNIKKLSENKASFEVEIQW